MLPDFPTLKKDLDDFFSAYLSRETQRRSGEFGQMARHRLFEGRANAIQRQREKPEAVEIVSASEELNFSAAEVANLGVQEIWSYLDEVAQKMADQIVAHFYKTLSEQCEQSGQVTKSEGGLVTADKLLEAFGKLQIDFDSSGHPRLPSIHIGPSQSAAMALALQKLETDAELRLRSQELIALKRREWLDREAARKLVG
ncbi:MAG: hypothetical protein Q8Q73_12590 [Stagnimonas sp.]|nr:hypothetical protein [Stagnimonas sp.]